MSFLEIHRGDAPLIVSMPHTGTEIPAGIESRLASPWLGRKDADWWVHKLYDFAPGLGATTVRTTISRTVIDVNRDPSGASLYPGQNTTELCPTTTFDGEALYRDGQTPGESEIAERRARYFAPYHAALQAEIERLKACHDSIVLWEAHSIRSLIPRLFDGELPHLNFGTNDGVTCSPDLAKAIEHDIADGGRAYRHVFNGRFKGGWTTRHYGLPAHGVHAMQLELSCRTYLREPAGAVNEANWPVEYDPQFASPLCALLHRMLKTSIAFANETHHAAPR
ncbi:MAG: N-formylglutamate deformylase [Proteobacteria bacterium]|nr:N-formylglutamate deformylase [Pseudomonadota bacterium]